MNYNFKTLLSTGAIYFAVLISKANAQTSPTIFETQNHCKVINNRSKVVINYRDTIPIYGIDTIRDGDKRKIICDIGSGQTFLIYDMDYYQKRDWLPSAPIDDSLCAYMLDAAFLAYMYKFYDTQGDEHKRDSVETNLLQIRKRATEYAERRQELLKTLFLLTRPYHF